EEIGEQVHLSRVTAWRYLEHLVRSGRAQLDHQYGQAGRPAKLYRAQRRPPSTP
ncbi:histidine kinase, partial [Deinococcus sp. 6YEL10]|nr:histidine kinase [Deinococcus sp. 6YEL10]